MKSIAIWPAKSESSNDLWLSDAVLPAAIRIYSHHACPPWDSSKQVQNEWNRKFGCLQSIISTKTFFKLLNPILFRCFWPNYFDRLVDFGHLLLVLSRTTNGFSILQSNMFNIYGCWTTHSRHPIHGNVYLFHCFDCVCAYALDNSPTKCLHSFRCSLHLDCVIAIVSIDFALFLAGCYEFIMTLNFMVDIYDFTARH